MSLWVTAPLPFPVSVASLPGERFICGPGQTGNRVQMAVGRGGFRPRLRRKHPTIESIRKSRDGKPFTVRGSPSLAADGAPQAPMSEPLEDVGGRHFLFNNTLTESNRAAILRQPRDNHVTRGGNLQPFTFSKELSHRHAARPFTLRNHDGYQLNTHPHILSLTALVLKGRNTFPVDHCKVSRPKVNHAAYIAPAVKDDHKALLYRDPVLGASRSFIQRISELSSLECETVRQEKLCKVKKCRRNPS
ncbi:uncharacterized protein si:ch211-171b20.3 [Synchiropus splendidus]|uniref:uncharacterized protein si:ch211-171b20.3 n=1 Tax=Synchiropus splendidus TaxID=270530 RepID=UPI00237D9C58|nr:uncharacterized protein si:ch211-171b20.3 [Synchiropus splendidus]